MAIPLYNQVSSCEPAMVHLMLQPVFLDLNRGAQEQVISSDDLHSLWSVATRAKSAIVHGRRLENLSWRLWYASTIRGRHDCHMAESLDSDDPHHCALDDNVDHADTGHESDYSSRHPQTRHNDSDYSTSHPPRHTSSESDSENRICSSRLLFTSTCTSILAEIQDASFKAGKAGGFSVSPPSAFSFTSIANRARSPATFESELAAPNAKHRKKKNVDKFLKKFRSNLEDISEQFDEKLSLTDDDDEPAETVGIGAGNSVQVPTVSSSNVPRTLSFLAETPTNIITHSMEHSPDVRTQPELLIHSAAPATAQSVPRKSMLSKLLKSSTTDSPLQSPKIAGDRPIPEPVHRAPAFIFNSNSGSSVSNQLEMMVAGRYERFRSPIRSPITVSSEDSPKPHSTLSPKPTPAMISQLSTSLSASTYMDSEEVTFDDQVVIW